MVMVIEHFLKVICRLQGSLGCQDTKSVKSPKEIHRSILVAILIQFISHFTKGTKIVLLSAQNSSIYSIFSKISKLSYLSEQPLMEVNTKYNII